MPPREEEQELGANASLGSGGRKELIYRRISTGW